jgi:hypothetical protein
MMGRYRERISQEACQMRRGRFPQRYQGQYKMWRAKNRGRRRAHPIMVHADGMPLRLGASDLSPKAALTAEDAEDAEEKRRGRMDE